jgi:HSP20 family protein
MATKSTKNAAAKAEAVGGFGLGGIFDGIQKLVEAAARLKDSGEISQTGEFNVPGLGEKGKGLFGFSIRSLAGGEGQGVKVQPFGNIHKKPEGGLSVEEDREPVVDVFEEGERIRVIAELPGVAQKDIQCEVQGDVLTITASGARRYHAEVLLPSRPAPESLESSYHNGILELKLRKAKP